jgi:hypothetical protein
MARKSSNASRQNKADTTQAASNGYERLRVSGDQQTVKWRFHRGLDQRWRWEKMAAEGAVIAGSGGSFASYVECIADAVSNGYKHLPSASGLVEPR